MRASHIRRGMIILFDNQPHRVLEYRHHTPGNLRAIVQTKLRNLITGTTFEHRFSATEDVERAVLEQHEMQYLYQEGSTHYFMDVSTYEQVGLDEEILGDALSYLKPEMTIQVEVYDGQPVAIQLPPAVELKVIETEPELKGATVTGSSKPAKLETGLQISVPSFIKEGDVIRVDTSEGKYIERVK
jgi:elongation factor P